MHQKSEGSDRNNAIVEGAHVTAAFTAPTFRSSAEFSSDLVTSDQFGCALTSNYQSPKEPSQEP